MYCFSGNVIIWIIHYFIERVINYYVFNYFIQIHFPFINSWILYSTNKKVYNLEIFLLQENIGKLLKNGDLFVSFKWVIDVLPNQI